MPTAAEICTARRDRNPAIGETIAIAAPNHAVKLLHALHQRLRLDFDDQRNPVEQLRGTGGWLHRP